MIEQRVGKVTEDGLFAELNRIREDLKRTLPDFPEDCCLVSIEQIHQKLGLKMCLGWYVVGGVVKRHWWNKGSGEEIIDISADQFDKFVPKIEILHPGEPRYERYVTSLYWEDVKIFCSPRG